MQPDRLEIDIARQRLDLLRDGVPVFSAVVSTALRGTGSTPGSLKTPAGRFVIAEKFGADQPSGMVLRSRLPTGEMLDAASADDQVTSRGLWLDGLDENNRNTKDRYIYLHGTNQEPALGTPVSHGCIRLANADILDLFSLVQPGLPVIIR